MVRHENFFDKCALYARCFKPSYLAPLHEVHKLSEITTDSLREKGIKALIFDADNTLTYYNECSIAEEVRDAFERLTSDFPHCIVSNTTSDRSERLCRNTHHARVIALSTQKPRREPFIVAFDYLNGALGAKAELNQVAVIGDRLLTDIAGGNNLGMYTIKVSPLNWRNEPLAHSAVRGVENFVLGLYRE